MSAPASRQRSISSRHASGVQRGRRVDERLDAELDAHRLCPLDLVDEVVVHLDDVHADFVYATGEFEYFIDAHRDAGDLPALAQGHVHQLHLVREVHVGADLLVEAVRADRPHAFAEARSLDAGVRYVAGSRVRSFRRSGHDRVPGQPLPQIYRHPVVSLVRWWNRTRKIPPGEANSASAALRDETRCYDLPKKGLNVQPF